VLRLRKFLVKIGPWLILGGLLALVGQLVFSRYKWGCRHTLPLKVLIVDYTVPFDSYKEHSGLIWLLNNLKVSAPEEREAWSAATDYLGYHPTDRAHPQRLSDLRSLEADLVYVADTYGVYRDDLRGLPQQRSHMDWNPLVFGGLSLADARALGRFAERRGTLVVEFNSFCDPTETGPRRLVEGLLGVRWSGWVGRVFPNPHDGNDVPLWLAREVRRQFGVALPREPMLVFAHRSGQLVYVTARTVDALAPQLELTAAGRRRFESARGGVPYFYWFSVVEAPLAQVDAELVLPAWLEERPELRLHHLPMRLPLLTERRVGASLRVYVAADLVDLDFDPGEFSNAQRIEAQAAALFTRNRVSSAPLFWRFFRPAMETLIDELAEIRRAR